MVTATEPMNGSDQQQEKKPAHGEKNREFLEFFKEKINLNGVEISLTELFKNIPLKEPQIRQLASNYDKIKGTELFIEDKQDDEDRAATPNRSEPQLRQHTPQIPKDNVENKNKNDNDVIYVEDVDVDGVTPVHVTILNNYRDAL